MTLSGQAQAGEDPAGGARPPLSGEGHLSGLGAVLLRNAVDPAATAALLAAADRRLSELEAMSPRELEARGAGAFRYHGALNLAALDPQMRILDGLHQGIVPAICTYLGCPSLDFRNCIVRRIDPQRPEASSSFHQDLQFLKPYAGRMVTVWIPLQPCDGSRPGLEILPRRLDRLAGASVGDYLRGATDFQPYVDRGPGIAYDSAVALGEAEVTRQAAGTKLWRPQLAVGDVLLFDGYTIHRSALAEGMRLPRTSAELRCVPHDPARAAG